MATEGESTCVDKLVKDIYGGDYDDLACQDGLLPPGTGIYTNVWKFGVFLMFSMFLKSIQWIQDSLMNRIENFRININVFFGHFWLI